MIWPLCQRNLRYNVYQSLAENMLIVSTIEMCGGEAEYCMMIPEHKFSEANVRSGTGL